MIKGKKEGDDRKKERKGQKDKNTGNKRQKQNRLNEEHGKEGWMDGREEGKTEENKERRLKCHANIIGTLPSCLSDDTVRQSAPL